VRKILGMTLAAIVSLMATIPIAMPAVTPTVQATVTVVPFCDIGLSSQTIDFGSPALGQTSGNQPITFSMPTGNKPTTPSVSGGIWHGLVPANQMLVGQTGWSSTTTLGQLTGSPVSIQVAVSHGQSAIVNFNVAIPNGQTADTYTQTMIITACGEA